MDCKPCVTDNCGRTPIVTNDCVIEGYVEEQLLLNGAPLKVYKLLGVHEQGKLVDLAGNGSAISSGDYAAFPASNAFENDCTEWRSTFRGKDVVAKAWLGYDFGPIVRNVPRAPLNSVKYTVDTKTQHAVTTLIIQQSPQRNRRATRVRIERSDDGITWFGVDIKTLSDDDKMYTFSIKQSPESRYWRIRPVIFQGGDNDWWGVSRLILTNYVPTQLNNTQIDPVFLENRARRYAPDPIDTWCTYTVQEPSTFLQAMGMGLDLTLEYNLRIPFNMIVRMLGRPMVIGDIIELPSETQYDMNMKPVRRMLEVNDITWATDGYTPGWKPTVLAVTAKPLIASEETQDVVGSLELPEAGHDNKGINVDMTSMFGSEVLAAFRREQLPERGKDNSPIHHFNDDEVAAANALNVPLQKLNVVQNGTYVEDALPPNGEPYTEGPKYPATPKHNDWHRLTYESGNIPTRLYQYNERKRTWIFKEQDMKARHDYVQSRHTEFLKNNN